MNVTLFIFYYFILCLRRLITTSKYCIWHRPPMIEPLPAGWLRLTDTTGLKKLLWLVARSEIQSPSPTHTSWAEWPGVGQCGTSVPSGNKFKLVDLFLLLGGNKVILKFIKTWAKNTFTQSGSCICLLPDSAGRFSSVCLAGPCLGESEWRVSLMTEEGATAECWMLNFIFYTLYILKYSPVAQAFGLVVSKEWSKLLKINILFMLSTAVSWLSYSQY